MPSSTAWRIIASRFSWFWRGTSFGSTSCHLNWYRIPPQEMTGIWSSVRPKRRYFMRERYDMTLTAGQWCSVCPTFYDHRCDKPLIKSEFRMTKAERRSNDEDQSPFEKRFAFLVGFRYSFGFRHSDFGILSDLNIRVSDFCFTPRTPTPAGAGSIRARKPGRGTAGSTRALSLRNQASSGSRTCRQICPPDGVPYLERIATRAAPPRRDGRGCSGCWP